MNPRKTSYVVEIHQLQQPYRNADSLQKATRLLSYEAANPFGAFQIGQTLSQTRPTKYLGTIQHIHHWVGEDEDDTGLVHRTILYVFNAPQS